MKLSAHEAALHLGCTGKTMGNSLNSLCESELFGVRDKVAIAIARIKEFEALALANNPAGYQVCISGGKDSTVITELSIMAGVKCEFVYAHTSVDHPETVYFIRREKKRLEELGYVFRIDYPRFRDGRQKTMWNRIVVNGLPTYIHRWCCKELKEFSGIGRHCIMGIRREESVKRRHTMILESCYKMKKIKVSPIADWSESDVWDFIHERSLPYNPLYDMGYKRVGCVGCPLSANMAKELEANPEFKALYFHAAEKHIAYRKVHGLERSGESVEEYFNWWLKKKQEKEEDDLFLGGGGIE